ncbi:acetyl-CoA carboxylase biotin carboxylase subunit family protein [Mesorhizobium sp. M0847]|uniref:ATP-grasp domain-containing protein n=1 Tax=unclassified Mesorhizobium TaxID=325217 RepID=UPI0033369575
MARRRALILIEGHNTSGLPYVQAANRLGLHAVNLVSDPGCYDYLAAEQVNAIRIDRNDLDSLIRECSGLRATYDIAGITGFADFDESTSATVAKLCRHFDLPGPDPVSIERSCDKLTQRQLLAHSGVPVPAYRLVADAAEAESCAAQIGLPVIVKPTVGSGSSGVRLCCDVDELVEHVTHLLGGKHVWRSSPKILVEEFAQGPFYSVEIMGNQVVGIVAADFGAPPHFVFRQTNFPAPLSADAYKRISDVSLSCLRALGLNWGPTNIELRWTKHGPIVIEVNPRLAGALEPQLVRLAYGIDLITEHLKLVIGQECDLRRRHSRSAAARFLIPDHEGTLDWIKGDDRAAAVSGVMEIKLYVQPMMPIVRRGDYRDCIGHILAVSPSLAQTETILQRAAGLIHWSITPKLVEQ